MGLEEKLGNGRPLKDLRDLIGVGLGLRTDAISEGDKRQNVIVPLADKLGIDMPQESLAGMLRFFMRGAIPFPMLTSSGSYVVFVNPVADSVLLTSWTISGGKLTLESARLVTGETLEGSKTTALTARWTNTDAMADTVQGIAQSAQKMTSNPTPSAMKRVEDILSGKQENHVLPFRRISAAALGTSGKNVSCVKALLNLGTDVQSLSRVAEKTNVSKETTKYELLPVSGIELGEITILVYSFKELPGSFVFAAADQRKNCGLFSLNVLRTIEY